jgi:hypothetical protein
MDDFKDVKARMDAAAPGPWRALQGFRRAGPMGASMPLVIANDTHFLAEIGPATEDAERAFLVHARADVERLYDEVEYLRNLLRAVLNDVPGTDKSAQNYLRRVSGETP